MPPRPLHKNKKITVVIVTRNRRKILAQALSSLKKQTVQPDEVIVVDNSSIDGTTKPVKSWSKSVPFSVRVVTESKIGYPFVYNRGLKEARNDWVGFIDDDCIADQSWYSTAVETIRMHPNVVSVLGFSETQKPTNIFSLATFLFHFDWKEKWTTGETVHNYEVLDNKNILYFRPFLRKHHIQFDESRIGTVSGAAEDCVLGWQIQRAGGDVVYQRQMKVQHKDPDHWTWYWKKYFRSLAAYLSFVAERESDQKEKKIFSSPKKVPFRFHATRLAHAYGQNLIWKTQFFLLVYTTVCMSYFIGYFSKFSRLKAWYIQQF